MLSWADQDVCRRLRVDIFERKYFIIFINQLRGNFFAADFAKQAVCAHRFSPDETSSKRSTIGVKPSRLRSCSPNCRASSSPETLPTRTRLRFPPANRKPE